MEDLQLGIENESGEIIGYKIDETIVDGLYATFDFDKINENIKNFEIEVENPSENMLVQKMSKREEMCIITILFTENEQVQYIVCPDLNVPDLNEMSENEMPQEFKNMILEGYEISKMSNL